MSNVSNTAIGHRLQEFIRYSELKQLAYNVAALQQEKMFHSLAILSVLPSEGKTLFCAALAMAYSETCHAKVLVVDTTTHQNKHSLILRECFNGSAPEVSVMSLEELRQGATGRIRSSSVSRIDKSLALDGEVVREGTAIPSVPIENDFSLIKKLAEDGAHQYGLVLLDTAPLETRNRSNVDPFLVARLSDASVLVVSRKLLDAPNVVDSLNLLKDPTLHLIGMISNEGHCQ